jgi:hypothetical protein
MGQAAFHPEVSRQELTVFFMTGENENTIRSFFQGFQEIDRFDAACARYANDLNIFRKSQFQGSRHVRSRISGLIATKSNDLGVKVHHVHSSNKKFKCQNLPLKRDQMNFKVQNPKRFDI